MGTAFTAIRDVNHSEELTFEQIFVADNPKSRGFRAIGRRVTDQHVQRRLDPLWLRREATAEDSSVVEKRSAMGVSPVGAGQCRPRRRFVTLVSQSLRGYTGRHDAGAPITPVTASGLAPRRGPPRQHRPSRH
jgi:hypothetical protein